MSDRIDIAPYQPDDIHSVVAVLGRCLAAEAITSETFARKVLLDQNFDTRGALVARDGSRVVCFGLGMVRRFQLEDTPPTFREQSSRDNSNATTTFREQGSRNNGVSDFDRSWITLLAVDAEYRRRKIGTKIVAALEDYFLDRECATAWVSSYAPNYFTPGVDVNAYPEALEFFKSLGYQELLRPLSMDANLVGLTTPEWVQQKESELAGKVTIECFRPELILPLLDWMRAEFPGDWQRFARESMTKITLGEFRPDNVWIAHEDGKVLGYCQHDNAGRFGPFGVSADERGRGIGAVLLFKCLHAMRAKGLHNAWFMWTDDKVARLYAQAGFVESRRFALMRKAIR